MELKSGTIEGLAAGTTSEVVVAEDPNRMLNGREICRYHLIHLRWSLKIYSLEM
jgi:hypothetical protein